MICYLKWSLNIIYKKQDDENDDVMFNEEREKFKLTRDMVIL